MEIWKPIKGYENKYQVSNLGRVKSLTKKTPTIKKLHNHKGYIYTSLYLNGKPKNCLVHRLVLFTFKIPPIIGKDYQVNHIDGDKTNNKLDNLEFSTPLENTRHAIKLKLNKQHSETHSQAKLSNEEVEFIRLAKKYFNGKELANKFNVSTSTISNILKDKNWVKRNEV